MTLFRVNPPRMTEKTADEERAEAVRAVVRASYNRRKPPPVTLAGPGVVQSGDAPREALAKGSRLYWTKHGR